MKRPRNNSADKVASPAVQRQTPSPPSLPPHPSVSGPNTKTSMAQAATRRRWLAASSHHAASGPFLTVMAVLLVALSSFATPVLADCECGYSAVMGPPGTSQGTYVFTELLETDFAHVSDSDLALELAPDADVGTGMGGMPAPAAGWLRQQYNISRATDRGTFGESFRVDNVVANPAGDANVFVGVGADSKNAPALRLQVVPPDPRLQGDDIVVPTGEIASSRLDMLYGTFRAGLKLTTVPGTCAAFFWYFNDTQEIDIEFLSRQFSPSNASWPVNLVLQSREAMEAGYDASKTGNFVTAQLPFDPTLAFHEYRIDFLPGRVFFYADTMLLADMAGPAVPTSPGHLILTHWSNGNPLWSGGPPQEPAALEVSYVKAYFNSSRQTRQADYAHRCRNAAAPGAVCAVPSVRPAQGTSGATTQNGTFFFSKQDNMTNNQTVFRGDAARSLGMGPQLWWPAGLATALALVGLELGVL